VAASGYRVLVLTVDAPVAGARLRDVHNGLSVPPKLTLRTLTDRSRHVGWWLNVITTRPADLMDRVFDPHITLSDIEWLRQVWAGPLVVKGVQSAADARRVVDAGADGVVVSNHGGRQLDRAVTPLEELPAVVAEVGRDAEVYVDGGVRTGSDVIAALGLGARAVLIGRAYLYGLMAGGQAGVTQVLDILRADMARTLALLGVPSAGEVGGEAVRLRP
jgi:L-lactate dehydrogenase (cytochrome)